MSVPVLRPPSHKVLRILARESERRLTLAEFDAWVKAPWTDMALEDAVGLIAWFMRRYPTPAARLQAARVAYRRATELMPPRPEH
jgi:hypothetical protein